MSIRGKVVQPSAEHERLRLSLCSVIRRKAPDMAAEEILAIFCQIVGQLIALQDQRRFTSDSVMALVSANIEMGNQHAVDNLLSETAGTA
ncbi:hypothetical protein [Mesorhizobium sp. B2-1-2]|uniref:hypothetical protein n=1 Tax=Mesorhizobium sp. B2-1-2 TaxID=2589973 RepID=UPI001129C19A|nr:hypothetical protein [Mesorhizobium sp. B2-1-2]TPN11691.1 hypothetical protein FJ971_09795 [Mesorhizobium sp. B2-1-2]